MSIDIFLEYRQSINRNHIDLCIWGVVRSVDVDAVQRLMHGLIRMQDVKPINDPSLRDSRASSENIQKVIIAPSCKLVKSFVVPQEIVT
jgi:hypothetical protein